MKKILKAMNTDITGPNGTYNLYRFLAVAIALMAFGMMYTTPGLSSTAEWVKILCGLASSSMGILLYGAAELTKPFDPNQCHD